MIEKSLVLVIAFTTAVSGYVLKGNPRCPKPTDIQTDYVKKSFNLTKFQGVW